MLWRNDNQFLNFSGGVSPTVHCCVSGNNDVVAAENRRYQERPSDRDHPKMRFFGDVNNSKPR